MYREDPKCSVDAVSKLELSRLAGLHELHSRIISFLHGLPLVSRFSQ
jgi:hypothetical protein